MAAAGESGGGCQRHDSTDAEGVDRDERTTEQRSERPQWSKWDEHNRRHAGGGARPLEISRSGATRSEGRPAGYCEESGRKLAQGTTVRAAPGGGTLSDISGEDPRL